jgi:signal transduction histidine kinase/DNA-binding response OmpR family regulator/CHASE3 domain sensor protein
MTPLHTPRRRDSDRFGPALPTGSLLGFLIAVAAVLVLAVLSVMGLQQSVTGAQSATHALEAVQQLQALLSLMKDAETGQRGYLLTGDTAYLEPYTNARAALASQMALVRSSISTNSLQQQRQATLERLSADKMAELAQTVARRQQGDTAGALAIVRTGNGKILMDRIRTVIAQMTDEERQVLALRQSAWLRTARITTRVTLAGAALLLMLIVAAALRSSREHRALQVRGWVRIGQMGLSAKIQGEQRLEALAHRALEFLAEYLDAQVGAAYLREDDGRFHHLAGYAAGAAMDAVSGDVGEGLVGQAARQRRVLHVQDVPPGHLTVTSSLGRSEPRELALVPAIVDDTTLAVIELGFFRRLRAADLELLRLVAESLGIAIRASKDRTRLEDLLEETQRQGEELQAQQEELRVSNEELEVQARSLKESQLQMEQQQLELQQTNAQLERQAEALGNAQSVLVDKATELERVSQYKSEFLANMSHELRTPLNSVLILAKILSDNKSGSLSSEQVQYARTITSSGNDLLAIINDVLDLAKVESGKIELATQTVDVRATVEQLSRDFKPLAAQKGLAFSVALESGAPEHITTDPQRLGQILKNLLSNAVKFTQRGEVLLKVSAASSATVSFTVQDSGIGIAEHEREIIFEAFRQADGSTHRNYGGTGLGLTISRDLARLLGGDIRIQSQPGLGSVFSLTLPRQHGAQAGVAALDAAATQVHAAAEVAVMPARLDIDDRQRLSNDTRLVLVIEDNVAFASILRDLVREMGFRCVVAYTVADGVACAVQLRPNAVLLDVNLPDGSGPVVLDQLKHNPHTRDIPVHVISVADHAQAAPAAGAIGYGSKPVTREALVSVLQRMQAQFAKQVRNVLIVEDDELERESLTHLLATGEVRITAVSNATQALAQLQSTTFDCAVLDLNLPDMNGYNLLQQMSEHENVAFPPVVVYTGRTLTRDEEQALRRFAKAIVIKDARSPQRLLDEVTLFLHQVEATLPPNRQRQLQEARNRDAALEGRRVLIVEDDVRNIFALTSALEPVGAQIDVARNGREAIDALSRATATPSTPIDLVLMDIMMPEMDGLTAMREIRKRPEWSGLPIIALTAKAMKDDHEKCLAAGASDYIAKPLDVERLLSLVRVWMPK